MHVALRLYRSTHALVLLLLQGVNRAFPYVSSDEADDIIESQTPVLFKLVIPKASSYKFRFLSCTRKLINKMGSWMYAGTLEEF